MDGVDRQRVELVPPLAPAALDDEEASLVQDFQMLHHRAAIQLGKQFAQHSRRLGARLERIHHPPPRTMGQGPEQQVVFFVI